MRVFSEFNKPRSWGYAGVFPGEFRVWDGDQQMNKLRFMVDNGFASTGMGQGTIDEMEADPKREAEIVDFVQKHDLQITLHAKAKWFADDIDETRRDVDETIAMLGRWAERLSCPIVTFCVGPYHRFMAKPTIEEQMERLAAVLPPLATACAEMKRPLGIENHADYYCSDLVQLCEAVQGLGIFLDTGNCFIVGEKPVPACAEAAPYTIGTHFKDHFVQPEPSGGLKFGIYGASLGDGHVGLRDIFAALQEKHPAPGKIVHQWELVPPKDMDPWESLERSWAFCRALNDTVAY